MSHPKGAALGTRLKGKWSCRWRTINFWTFLIFCRDVPLGYEIKCKSVWAWKQIAACNLLSVRIITYIIFFLSISMQSWTTSTEHSYILGFYCPSHLFSPTLEQDKWKFSWDLRKSSKYKHIMYWATLSWQTDCLTPHTEHMATASPFCCVDGAEDIFRGSRVRVMEEAMNLLLCIPGCTICYAQFSFWLLWYVFHKE